MNSLLVRSKEEEGIVDPPRLLTGRDIIARLGVPEGPAVGRLLEALREAQAAGEVTRSRRRARVRRTAGGRARKGAGRTMNAAEIGFIAILAIVVAFYLIVLRPQQQEQSRQQKDIKDLQVGDEVLTTSGFLGTVKDVVIPEIGPGADRDRLRQRRRDERAFDGDRAAGSRRPDDVLRGAANSESRILKKREADAQVVESSIGAGDPRGRGGRDLRRLARRAGSLPAGRHSRCRAAGAFRARSLGIDLPCKSTEASR